MRKTLRNALIAAASLACLGWTGVASAATVIDLTAGNTDISGYAGPYGTVTVDLTSPTTANVTFQALDTATDDFFFIDSGIADVNVNAATWGISAITTNGLGGPAISDNGSKEVDGWGVLNETIDQHDGYGSRATTISFTLTDTSGTWSSSDNVLTPNEGGTDAAAHIAVCVIADGCGAGSTAIATGYAAGGPSPTPVPEPATWSLMIVGVGGIGAAMRATRRRNSKALIAA